MIFAFAHPSYHPDRGQRVPSWGWADRTSFSHQFFLEEIELKDTVDRFLFPQLLLLIGFRDA